MAIYYIDYTAGNDSWDGLAPEYVSGSNGPWKNATKASGAFNAGDTIKFKCGETWTYQGFTVNSSGSAGSPITFTSYGTGNKPKFHHAQIITDWVEVDETGVYTKGYSACGWLLEDGVGLVKASDQYCSDGNWWFHEWDTIYYKPTDGVPGDHTVERAAGSFITLNPETRSYIVIDGLHIECVGSAIYKGLTYAADHITVQNCHIERAYSGFWFDVTAGATTTELNILNNTFDYVSNAIYLFTAATVTATVSRNVITHACQAYGGNFSLFDAEGISLQNMKNSVIEYNEISGEYCTAAGIVHWDFTSGEIETTNNVFRYNYIHDISGAGIAHGGTAVSSGNCEIYGNIITNYGSDITGAPHGGLRLNRAQTSATPSKVYNNVCYNGDVGIYLNALTDYYTINNNIVHTMSSYLVQSNVLIGNNIFDYNCYKDAATGTPFYYNAGKNWADWKTWCGGDSHSLTSDPLLIDPTDSPPDFRLKPNSPCINKSVEVGLAEDYWGNYVPQGGAPDIGAYEYPSSNMWF